VDVVKRRPVTRAAWSRIRLFAMDVDGVLTDGTVCISSDGRETKAFAIIDGLGLILLRAAGVDTAWISGRPSECAYMGDDFIDAPAIAAAGIGISVPDALPAALAAARHVTRRRAGHGAVREVCDLILAARGLPNGNTGGPLGTLPR
jgi:3-deoxy-D-manno-octulosonate 8-phosphate phosphatase (KDO 8-P phosphatase)